MGWIWPLQGICLWALHSFLFLSLFLYCFYLFNSHFKYRFDAGTSWIELRLRVEVGAGCIKGTHIGLEGSMFGVSRGRWAYVLSGDEVDNTLAADRLNTAGMSCFVLFGFFSLFVVFVMNFLRSPFSN
jgi:hypothetical protein